ncbi:MAG: UDP-3-O-(3-hydroxymyristoyl)glucosamine N-acyltransferase [Sulfurospirillum sp.]|nr:UDP-3-O-(3-hydroxymyristoyl)glucosamine N-acyltransferase [Sulfurospirillum sp.]MBL0702883.1 UDP-3-O-(3-hydroxymyristoyl)glucosamine N-acyltransferase [Sulfurospirillum sp.]
MNLVNILKESGVSYSGKDFVVFGFETLKNANKSQICFFNDITFLDQLKSTKAGAVILKEENLKFLPITSSAIVSENPYLDMARLSKYFIKKPFCNSGKIKIHNSAVVDKNAVIGNGSTIEEGAYIMAGVVVGANVRIGKNTLIYPNVVIYDDSIIGANCSIQAGVIIGSDGYGYAHTKAGEHVKIHHTGNVILEDDVEIGANTTIDRAVFGTTCIGKNTKIDNLVQIGHNCKLGESCLMVSQSGLAGSTTLGRNVVMGGQSAAGGHLSIGDYAQLAARSGVTKSIEGKKIYGGFPLMLQKNWLKTQIKMIRYFDTKKNKIEEGE